MILRKLADAITGQNWFTVVLEIFIVVVGIFIGLQVDDWNEARKDRQEETRYLARLQLDISKDLELLDHGKRFADEREEQIRFLMSLADDPDIAEANPNRTIILLEKASWESYLPIGPRTYEELLSSGRTTLIRDEELRDALGDYYRQIERWDVILETQHILDQYRFATAGLLSGDHLIAIEKSTSGNFQFPDIDPEVAVEAARRFSKNDEAIRWLPQMLHYHALVEAIVKVHEEAARAMIAKIEQDLHGDRE